MMRTNAGQRNENKTVFHDEEIPLFFCNGSVIHEDEMVFINEEALTFTEEEQDVYEEFDMFYENSEWFLIESMVILVIHIVYIVLVLNRLNETIGRHFE